MGIFYATVEDVRNALDVKEAAHNEAQVIRALGSASRSIEGRLKRKLYPITATRYFEWPPRDYSEPHRLWLDENEVISVTTLVSGGTTIASTDYFLEPVNSGPPFRWIEIDQESSASFQSGNTRQRSIVVTGLFGWSNEQNPAGALAEALDGSETSVDVTDASLMGIGSILTCESERMVVTGREMLTTGQVLQSAMTNIKSDQTVDVVSGAALHKFETILIDSERMKIVDIAGNNATVLRGYDGTTIAAHSLGATIYALRTLVVERGALGTTAAAHADTTAITTWAVPEGVGELAVAEAINVIEQEVSGYGRRVYSDEAERDSAGQENNTGMGLSDMRGQVKTTYGRKFRKRAV